MRAPRRRDALSRSISKCTSAILIHRESLSGNGDFCLFAIFLALVFLLLLLRSLLSAISFSSGAKLVEQCYIIIYRSSSSSSSFGLPTRVIVLRSRRLLSVAFSTLSCSLVHFTASFEIPFVDLSRFPRAIFRDQGSYSQTHCGFVTRAIACDEDRRESQHRR